MELLTFYSGALLLGAVAGLFVIFPIFRTGSNPVDSDQDEGDTARLNVALYRERLDDLLDDSAEEEDAEALIQEARRSLLDDTAGNTGGGESGPTTSRPWALLVAALLLPCLAALIYLDFGLGRGAIPDVRLASLLREADPSDSDAYRQFMHEVETRAARKPDGWGTQFLLSRVYVNLEEFASAIAIFAAAGGTFSRRGRICCRATQKRFIWRLAEK